MALMSLAEVRTVVNVWHGLLLGIVCRITALIKILFSCLLGDGRWNWLESVVHNKLRLHV